MRRRGRRLKEQGGPCSGRGVPGRRDAAHGPDDADLPQTRRSRRPSVPTASGSATIRLCGELRVELDGQADRRGPHGTAAAAVRAAAAGSPARARRPRRAGDVPVARRAPDAHSLTVACRCCAPAIGGAPRGARGVSLMLPDDTWVDVEAGEGGVLAAEAALAAGDAATALAQAARPRRRSRASCCRAGPRLARRAAARGRRRPRARAGGLRAGRHRDRGRRAAGRDRVRPRTRRRDALPRVRVRVAAAGADRARRPRRGAARLRRAAHDALRGVGSAPRRASRAASGGAGRRRRTRARRARPRDPDASAYAARAVRHRRTASCAACSAGGTTPTARGRWCSAASPGSARPASCSGSPPSSSARARSCCTIAAREAAGRRRPRSAIEHLLDSLAPEHAAACSPIALRSPASRRARRRLKVVARAGQRGRGRRLRRRAVVVARDAACSLVIDDVHLAEPAELRALDAPGARSGRLRAADPRRQHRRRAAPALTLARLRHEAGLRARAPRRVSTRPPPPGLACGPASRSPGFADAAWRATGGHPLLLRELWRRARDERAPAARWPVEIVPARRPGARLRVRRRRAATRAGRASPATPSIAPRSSTRSGSDEDRSGRWRPPASSAARPTAATVSAVRWSAPRRWHVRPERVVTLR